LIRDEKILFDAAQRINTIKIKGNKHKEELRQIRIAKEIAGLKSHQQREIIRYAKKFPNSSLKNYKKRVITPRETRRIHVVIVSLDEPMFKELNRIAKKRSLSLEKMIVELIDEKIQESRK